MKKALLIALCAMLRALRARRSFSIGWVASCLLALSLNGCAYFWESVLSSPGPQVVHEHTQTRQVGDGKETSTNWWTGDGQSHWCYCWENKGTKVCSGDCR